MRVVFAHDFLEAYGGAERVLAEAAAEFPDAEVFAIVGRPEVVERTGVADRFTPLLPLREPLLTRYRALAPLYPELVRRRRLPAADVLVTSHYAYVQGLRTVNDAPQLCYIHSPLRHAWSQEDHYAAQLRGGMVARRVFPAFAAAMRRADRRAARHVTRYVTPGEYTAQLVQQAYGVRPEILAPPVDTDVFRPSGSPPGDAFLFAGRLVEAYKKPSLVVRAFAQMPDQKVRIAGDGPAMAALREMATPNVEFLGRLDDREIVEAMAGCRAAIFPSVDDFGLIPVEVAACGRPVLAYAGGGALGTVAEGLSGTLFPEQSVAAIVAAVRAFDDDAWDPQAIRAHALRWDRRHFRAGIRRHVEELASGATGRRDAEPACASA